MIPLFSAIEWFSFIIFLSLMQHFGDWKKYNQRLYLFLYIILYIILYLALYMSKQRIVMKKQNKHEEHRVLNTSIFPCDCRRLMPRNDEKCTCQFFQVPSRNSHYLRGIVPFLSRMQRRHRSVSQIVKLRHMTSLGNTTNNWIHEWQRKRREQVRFQDLTDTKDISSSSPPPTHTHTHTV